MAPKRTKVLPPDWGIIRPLYEHSTQTVQEIADAFHISASMISNHARKNFWHMRSAQMASPRGKRSHQPISRHALVMRMYRVVEAQITEMEKKLMQQEQNEADSGPVADEKEARLLGTLARTLEKLIDLENASQDEKKPQEASDLNELKRALADRMENLKT